MHAKGRPALTPRARARGEKILIRAPNWLGDCVMSIPAVKGIKKLFPGVDLYVLSRTGLSGIWKLVPEVKEVLCLSDGLTPIKRQGFSMVLLLTNSFGSALRMFLTGIPRRRGYRVNTRSCLLTQPVSLPGGTRHQVEYFLGLIDGLGKVDPDTVPKISIPPEAHDKGRNILTRYGWRRGEPVIGNHATASYGPAKCWLPGRFSELIEELIKIYNPWILLCGGRDEEEDIRRILDGVSSPEKIINVAGKTDIEELAALISLCRVFIANDSGPMHLAGAVDVPVVAIFGSTDPGRTGPGGKAIVIKRALPCSPCFRRKCPRGLECMHLIKVQDVISAVMALYKQCL